MKKQKLLLVILVGIFVLVVAYAFWATPRQQRISGSTQQRPATVSQKPSVKTPGTAPAEETRVHLELLTRKNGTAPDFKRNIFRFWQPPPPPLPPPPPPPPEPVIETPVTEEVQRELARFTFLGFLLKDGVKKIFLSANEEIFVVKKGDRFGKDNRFLVTELTPQLLTISQNDDARAITVPLVEQTPLTPDLPGATISPLRRPPVPGVSRFRRGFSPQSGAVDRQRPAEPVGPSLGEATPFEQQPAEEAPPLEQPPAEKVAPSPEAPRPEQPSSDVVLTPLTHPLEQSPADGTSPPPDAVPNEVTHD